MTKPVSPGPWTVDQRGGVFVIRDATDRNIGDLRGGANATLAAAAPEMLGALLDLCEWSARTGDWDSPVWDRARAIIAKAKGA